jgi:hypothetical protein
MQTLNGNIGTLTENYNAIGDSVLHLFTCGVRPIGIGAKHRAKLAEWEACNAKQREKRQDVKSANQEIKVAGKAANKGVDNPLAPPVDEQLFTPNNNVATTPQNLNVPVDSNVPNATNNNSKTLMYAGIGVAVVVVTIIVIVIVKKNK